MISIQALVVILCLLVAVAFSSTDPEGRMYCGRKLMEKVFSVCPEGCTTKDNLMEKVCHTKVTDEGIKAICCP